MPLSAEHCALVNGADCSFEMDASLTGGLACFVGEGEGLGCRAAGLCCLEGLGCLPETGEGQLLFANGAAAPGLR